MTFGNEFNSGMWKQWYNVTYSVNVDTYIVKKIFVESKEMIDII